MNTMEKLAPEHAVLLKKAERLAEMLSNISFDEMMMFFAFKKELVETLAELGKLDPELWEEAKDYYYAEDMPDEKEYNGYGDAMFSLFLTAHSFKEADNLTQYEYAKYCFYNSFSDVCSFSEAWSVERGSWIES